MQNSFSLSISNKNKQKFLFELLADNYIYVIFVIKMMC